LPYHRRLVIRNRRSSTEYEEGANERVTSRVAFSCPTRRRVGIMSGGKVKASSFLNVLCMHSAQARARVAKKRREMQGRIDLVRAIMGLVPEMVLTSTQKGNRSDRGVDQAGNEGDGHAVYLRYLSP
jgi:hypothetical protein